MSDRVGAIVLAAGEGARFGDAKQFQELLPGVRLVDAAIASAAQRSEHVVLVVPEGHIWRGRQVSQVVSGGATRLESVLAGLNAIPAETEVVVIHDAAHPLASGMIFADVIAAVVDGADGAVPFHPVADMVKKREDDGTVTTVGRDGLGLAQMPMAFRAAALRHSHEAVRRGGAEYREDSMLLEALGFRVVATSGQSENIHVVTPGDLEHARALAVRSTSG